ncbi:MAG: galactose mutarotase [Bacteroidales bacterium]|nr:galactose mutarotase [Bacteroidales bacterium]
MIQPKVYTIKNQSIEVSISDFGLIIQKMLVKDVQGQFTDVVLGFHCIESYLQPEYLNNYPYLGAIMGRCANRIGGAMFSLNGINYSLAKNAGNDHLHGGKEGFDKKMWNVEEQDESHIIFSYISRDGEEGYPGNLTVKVTFTLQDRSLLIHDEAVCDKDCFVNITHHPYFNLFPNDETVKRHELIIFSDQQLETKNLIPTGKMMKVPEYNDFTQKKSLLSVIENQSGLDHTFLFKDDHQLKLMACLSHPDSLLQLQIMSDHASMQVYTGAFLAVKQGKGRDYPAFSGVAFEPQKYPDAPHHNNFPTTLLTPKMRYNQSIIYRFLDK